MQVRAHPAHTRGTAGLTARQARPPGPSHCVPGAQDQYVELSTALDPSASLYGLGESVRTGGFALPRNGTVLTLWARDSPAALPDQNIYSAWPFYMELRPGAKPHPVLGEGLECHCTLPGAPRPAQEQARAQTASKLRDTGSRMRQDSQQHVAVQAQLVSSKCSPCGNVMPGESLR